LFGCQEPIVTTSSNKINNNNEIGFCSICEKLSGIATKHIYFNVPEEWRISGEEFCNLDIVEELRINITGLFYFKDETKDMQESIVWNQLNTVSSALICIHKM
jgi:hypothetical protein